MKTFYLLTIFALLMAATGCKKDSEVSSDPINNPVPDPDPEKDMLTDFANVLANPNYRDIQAKANALNLAAQALNASLTDANLDIAQDAWRAIRVPWEQCEGYLFGPVEDFNYDPETDTWPVNTVELDSLLSSSASLTLEDIDSLQNSLKGYHPAEYLLFGVGGTKKASELTPRELQYLLSLTQSLYNSATNLVDSWDTLKGDFTSELITAGDESTRFSTRKDAFVAIATSMGSICNEVANNKMQRPLESHDSTLVESQYAHNATLDFKNNLIGIQNAYLCRYGSTGHSLHELVSETDLSLDNYIQAQITSAIGSLDAINPNYGLAIFTQQDRIKSSQFAINSLHDALNNLVNFIQTNIKD